ncbi:bone morphogenetic protein receptor type-2 [Caerostris extrusa]|uniref:Serine/threonine-protein kinase receptor n=1 Tax=Caerostris extrusa TaxID=172846 RepID=A0AAV4UHW8_CAEEX|nr:bone morphogenetic protein receptor type-2 [Caerostris extrusa]
MLTKTLILGIICIFVTGSYASLDVTEETYCAFSKKEGKFRDKISVERNGELLNGNTVAKCPTTHKFCYAIWQDFTDNATVIVGQGCWSAGEFYCSKDSCFPTRKPKKDSNTTTHFCCCKGNMCNQNISNMFFSAEGYKIPQSYSSVNRFILTISFGVIVLVLVSSLAFIIWHLCSSSKPSLDSMKLPSPPPTINMDNLTIAENIGRGQYGRVHLGTLLNQSVAVKLFSSQNYQNYLSEKYIYCLPFMDHPHLPKLIGAAKRIGPDEQPEYLLALSYVPNGCLKDYLINNILDWKTLCKMAISIANGLAHLHSEIKMNGMLKMAVVHRDLSSKNILVKADGSCMLCDFEYAICVCGSKCYLNGEQDVDSTSLKDVGTLGYMAPEVMNGAVNLKNLESSLKQIDVYALGLILWELATRCSDLSRMDVPKYQAPFVAELGHNFTLEKLHHLVAIRKSRPVLPDPWKNTNNIIRLLNETIEDCWDHDAEARLTAHCVANRFSNLLATWDQHKFIKKIMNLGQQRIEIIVMK